MHDFITTSPVTNRFKYSKLPFWADACKSMNNPVLYETHVINVMHSKMQSVMLCMRAEGFPIKTLSALLSNLSILTEICIYKLLKIDKLVTRLSNIN